MAKIYDITEVRARQIKLATLKEMFGDLFHRVAIPLIETPGEELNYILPASLMRYIDDLTIGELDELINGQKRFFILR